MATKILTHKADLAIDDVHKSNFLFSSYSVINFNVKFQAAALADHSGRNALGSILKVYFQRGGMQAQVNMIDPALLQEARDNPDRYPNLLIRVSGYSAYFNDLSPQMKDEIISRSFNTV